MKLGISYNIFDGEEMLPHTLKNLKEFAHFTIIVYQETSNFGNKNEGLGERLKELYKDGLIDMLHCYEPTLSMNDDGTINFQSGSINEQKKRQYGLDACRANGCDTYMTLDCDELYDKKQFEWAMSDFERGGYDTSFTNLLTYYKKPTLQISPPETWYQPLFIKIGATTRFQFQNPKEYPVFTDQTKMVKAGHCRVYTREEIQQYHYAYVRHNIKSKVLNSSARVPKQQQEFVMMYYDEYKEGNKAILLGMQIFEVKEVENKFNIEI